MSEKRRPPPPGLKISFSETAGYLLNLGQLRPDKWGPAAQPHGVWHGALFSSLGAAKAFPLCFPLVLYTASGLGTQEPGPVPPLQALPCPRIVCALVPGGTIWGQEAELGGPGTWCHPPRSHCRRPDACDYVNPRDLDFALNSKCAKVASKPSESSFLVRSAIPLASLGKKNTKYVLRFPFSALLDTQSLMLSERWKKDTVQLSGQPTLGAGDTGSSGPSAG